jgi:transposase
MKIVTVGLDIAKQTFQAHGVDGKGKVVLRKRLRRVEVSSFFAGVEPCLIGLEASGGAHYWFRVLSRLGHTVRLIAPQFVKPYVKSQKNDANDAEAICEAVSRPSMRFVPAKRVEQQDLQCLHRVRSRLIGCRTQLVNQIRGLLAEYGIVLPQHVAQLRRHLPALLEDDSNELTISTRYLLHSLYEELIELETKIASADQRIERAFRENAECQRIGAVEGIGPVTATAVVAAISDGHAFRNGRQFAAWLGLVPRQHSSGGKTKLLGISKRGDPYLRTLLVHGARSVVYRAKTKTDCRSRWINDKQQRLGTARACVRAGQQKCAHSLVPDREATSVPGRCLIFL